MLKAVAFVGAGLAALAAAGPLVGTVAAMAGVSSPPVWMYAGCFSALLLAATALALKADRRPFASLGLSPTPQRGRQLACGFAAGAVLFAVLALVRGASVGAVWTFSGVGAAPAAATGAIIALLLLLPEELLFRGYAFQRFVDAWGAWPAIVISALLFGAYHVVGSGMWAMGAFFAFAMPAVGGVVFGWAAVRGNGLALPLGLHLGGNWVQSSVLALRPESAGAGQALWMAPIGEVEMQALWAPDLSTHVPYMAAMMMAVVILRRVLRAQPQTV